MEKNAIKLMEHIYDCQAMCKYCFNACLEEKDVHMMTRCIKLDVECAEICGMTASSVAYNGDFTREMLEICINACEMCASECRGHDKMHCIECAKACEECAKACRRYIS